MKKVLFAVLFLALVGCKSKDNTKEVWVYTSLYKDTIADIKPKLKADFPDIEVHFFQAGSEEIATKVNAELIAGGTKADLLISSDRFWYEEMANQGNLHAFKPTKVNEIDPSLRHPQAMYTTLSIPVMVLAYNKEGVTGDAPKTFKEMAEDKWRDMFSTGSPLASGTNFTTVAFLANSYGWDYFKKLQANNTISQGGNSAVIRRMQSKERPVGWVLLENLLRFQGKDDRLKTVFPDDGVVIHNNVLAITKKKGSRENVEKIAQWLFAQKGQEAMIRSYMYSPFESFDAPKGAPPLRDLRAKSFPWTRQFLDKVVKSRESIKEKFTEIMFN